HAGTTGPAAARTHRGAVAAADPAQSRTAAARLAAAVAASLRGPGRALPRGLLLGFLLHHAGPGRKRPARAGAADAGQLRPPGRHLGPYPQRQPQLLSQPLAAAVLLAHGDAAGAAGSGRPGALPAAAAARACLLDGRRGSAAAGPGASPGCAPGRWKPAQPLLGRPR